MKPEDGLAMVAETGRGAARTLGAIARALADAEGLILATDPDRESEAIAWQVLDWLEERDVPDQRLHGLEAAAAGDHGIAFSFIGVRFIGPDNKVFQQPDRYSRCFVLPVKGAAMIGRSDGAYRLE